MKKNILLKEITEKLYLTREQAKNLSNKFYDYTKEEFELDFDGFKEVSLYLEDGETPILKVKYYKK